MSTERGNWYGIPGDWIDDPTAVDGKRFIATFRGWRVMRVVVIETCKNRCEDCGQEKPGDLHHVYGRGFGGGKREDRPVVWMGDEMIRMVIFLCRACHKKTEIKPWGSWRQDVNHPVRLDSGNISPQA